VDCRAGEAVIEYCMKRHRFDFNLAGRVSWFILFLLWLGSAWAGQPQDTKSANPPASAAGQERKISPQQAQELLRSVDEIVQFASQDTALPIKDKVKRRLIDRDEVEAYVAKNTAEDENARRLQRSQLVLKKFGLLPRDFDLGKFLVALFKEQVAGYYDPKTKTVNLLDWLDPEQQKPVLAHELTHALQDQSFGLEKFMKPAEIDLEKKKNVSTEDIENDEISAARQAIVEGQAMVVLIDYMLKPFGQSLASSGEMVNALKQGMLAGTADSVQFRGAPLYIREAVIFPYRYGIDFVGQVLSKGDKQKAFAGLLENPPRSTRQIMEPATYLSKENLEPMRLPDLKEIFKNYDRFDIGAVGEFDVSVLISQYAGAEASRALYPHWRGGYYYAARPRGQPDAPLSLLYVSRWSNAEHAAEFAAIYAKALGKRYQQVQDPAEDSKIPQARLAALETLTGKRNWSTEDGPVVIEAESDTVVITETFDQQLAERVQTQIFGAAAVAR
jgi:hypothetical protein